MGITSRIHMSWEDVETATGRIITQLKERKYYPEHIVGVTKGGVIPAALIHQAFPKATFSTIQVRSYAHELTPKDPEFIGQHQWFLDEMGTLIVDEILDTGGTYNHLKKHYKHCTYATLSIRDNMVASADVVHGWIWGRGWIVFPWETVEEVAIPF